MNNEREQFLAIIAASPCDCQLRAIYADWLEEHGETMEADRQRRWKMIMKQSRHWLVQFCKTTLNGLSYTGMLKEVAACYTTSYGGEIGLIGPRIGGRDGFDFPPEFWTHYEIATGRSIKEDKRATYFSCSC